MEIDLNWCICGQRTSGDSIYCSDTCYYNDMKQSGDISRFKSKSFCDTKKIRETRFYGGLSNLADLFTESNNGSRNSQKLNLKSGNFKIIKGSTHASFEAKPISSTWPSTGHDLMGNSGDNSVKNPTTQTSFTEKKMNPIAETKEFEDEEEEYIYFKTHNWVYSPDKNKNSFGMRRLVSSYRVV